MKRIITFSGRQDGNCDQVARYIAGENDQILHARDLDLHGCTNCGYECFHGPCRYREDAVYETYNTMPNYDKVILIVPMYCGNPSSLYFAFHERCQDYFMHNDNYEEIIGRLYIIGIYGSSEETPDFIPCLEKWFSGSPYTGRVLGIERHRYGQKMEDWVLDVEEVREQIRNFLKL